MSLGGPCLWIPSLSSPVAPTLSAVTSQISGVGRLEERVSSTSRISSPLSIPSRDRELTSQKVSLLTEMQGTGVKAENALPSSLPISGITAGSGSYREGEIPPRETIHSSSAGKRDDALPRMKLEIPSGSTNYAIPQSQGGFGQSDASQAAHGANNNHEKDSTASPCEEKGETIGEDEGSQSPSLEKKKMKRFRLTHNQTRFLMSEFTRQAHPDAAHRERLSREIPGLTPRQVQVWFQNRRAKLKRLTTNDRERMLKSRALPEDFDTTKVLRTPFESKSTGPTPTASPHDYGAPNPDFATLRALRTDFYQRPNEDEYLVSPLSSASTAGTYMSSAGRSDVFPSSGMMFSRPAASASMSDLHRTIRHDYSITRSSSLSDASSHPPSFHQAGMHMHNRFAPSSIHSGLPYMRQTPLEYGVPRHPGSMVAHFDHNQPFEGSVSPTDSQGAPMTYEMGTIGSQPQSFQAHVPVSAPKDYNSLGPQLPSHGRPLSTLQSLPASSLQQYRPYPYANASGSMGSMPYTQPNASTISLPTSFAPTESSATSQDQVPPSQPSLESIRARFGNSPYNYAGYLPQ